MALTHLGESFSMALFDPPALPLDAPLPVTMQSAEIDEGVLLHGLHGTPGRKGPSWLVPMLPGEEAIARWLGCTRELSRRRARAGRDDLASGTRAGTLL